MVKYQNFAFKKKIQFICENAVYKKKGYPKSVLFRKIALYHAKTLIAHIDRTDSAHWRKLFFFVTLILTHVLIYLFSVTVLDWLKA